MLGTRPEPSNKETFATKLLDEGLVDDHPAFETKPYFAPCVIAEQTLSHDHHQKSITLVAFFSIIDAQSAQVPYLASLR